MIYSLSCFYNNSFKPWNVRTNLETEYFFNFLMKVSTVWIHWNNEMSIGTNNWDVESRNKFENVFQSFQEEIFSELFPKMFGITYQNG